jgi:PBP1b-binding outer membrane lipoprotein LpoB
MKKVKSLLLALTIALFLSSCYTMVHTMGTGASGSEMVKERQWYALWGLVPITNVDSKAMAGGAENYTVKTQRSFVDQIIGMFTGIVTIYPMSVTVTK